MTVNASPMAAENAIAPAIVMKGNSSCLAVAVAPMSGAPNPAQTSAPTVTNVATPTIVNAATREATDTILTSSSRARLESRTSSHGHVTY